MLFESLSKYIAKSVIIVEAADFGNDPESLKSFIVQFVDQRKMWVGDNHVG